MIFWIASYPRSGNTLTTQIFYQVFKKKCYEKYNNFYNYLNPTGEDNSYSEIGLNIYTEKWPEFYEKASTSKVPFFIKTHHPPEDDAPCIYILRNGLNAIESHYHYIRNIDNYECTWDDVISGYFFPYLTWGKHLDEWQPLNRPKTLIVHFEKLVQGDLESIEKISEFTGLSILGKWENAFDEHKKKNPNFFRSGQPEMESQVPETMKKLFSLVNGDWMNTFQYDGDWITHSSQIYWREFLCKKALQNQELLKEMRLLKSDLDWMRSNTTLIQKNHNQKYLNNLKRLFLK
jgi:hypothetical protein